MIQQGLYEDVEKVLEAFDGLSASNRVTAIARAYEHLAGGDEDQALYWLEQAAELKRIMKSDLQIRIERAGFGDILKSDTGLIGEEYLAYWMETIKNILTIIS